MLSSAHCARGAAPGALRLRPDGAVNLDELRVECLCMPLADFHVYLDGQLAARHAQVPHLRARQVLLQPQPHHHRRALVLDPEVTRVLQAQKPCEHGDDVVRWAVMTSLLVVVECDGVAMLLDARFAYRSLADLTILRRQLAEDVRTYAKGHKTVHFAGNTFAEGSRYTACIERACIPSVVHIDNLADFICQ